MSGLCAIKQVVLADRKRVAVRAVRASYSFLYKIVASVPVYGLRCLLRFGGKFAVYGGWAWGCVCGGRLGGASRSYVLRAFGRCGSHSFCAGG